MNAGERLAASPRWRHAVPPRIPPGGLAELGPRTWLMGRAMSLLVGTDGARLFDLPGRDPRLMRRYLRFAASIVLFGRLERADVELVTLRTAWNVGAWYEFFHHIALSRLGGLSIDSVERVADGPEAAGWNPRQAALLRAADELHAQRMISEPTLAELRGFLDRSLLVELCMLVGHYEMLAMFLKTAGAVPEPGAWEHGPLSWLRSPDDSDRLAPRWLPALNKRVTNRVQGVWAPYLPPYAVIVHRGRVSGREYRTPVLAVRSGRLLFVALPYGDRTDWVRNLLAEGRGGVERLGRLHRVSGIRVTDVPTAGELVPRRARRALGLTKILVAEFEES
ncbi:carboxymuconolactone decarboxylase family protein [Actinocorallia aurantiaca]|uniref:Carboxymuconolactone decarboxylase-like domain-containing protein n=1 Tax=Actinocorallia aurantiaca TaxID=46204 RepID=A0ABN3UAG7_9ACTN